MTKWQDTGHPRSVDSESASEWGSSQVLEEYEAPVVPVARDYSFAAVLRFLWALLRG